MIFITIFTNRTKENIGSMPELKLEVGKRYRDGRGFKVTIEEKDKDGLLLGIDQLGCRNWYYLNGYPYFLVLKKYKIIEEVKE